MATQHIPKLSDANNVLKLKESHVDEQHYVNGLDDKDLQLVATMELMEKTL